MKRKFSLNALLHNERVMLILSAVAAVVIWAVVSFGPGNIQQRTITVTQKVDLNGTIAGQNELRVIGQDTFTVSVTVEGARSVIFNLDPEDINIRPAFSEIQGAGVSELAITATKVKAGAYEINAISPATIKLNCDFWVTKDVPLKANADTVSVKDQKTQHKGTPRIEADTMQNGTITVEGPRAAVSRIVSVEARIEEERVLDVTARMTATLEAFDADGNKVDTTYCAFVGATEENTVDVTIPVLEQKVVELSYELLNKPAGLPQNALVKLTPSTVTLDGEAAVLESAAAIIGNIGTFDFDHLRPEDAQQTITLNVPENIRVLEGNTVTVELAIDKYTKKTLNYSVDGAEDVTVQNLPAGKKITIPKQLLSDIVLYGPTATLRRITAKDLVVTLDAAVGSGLEAYKVRITVPKYDNVWVYYGKDDTTAYSLSATVE